MRSVFPLAPLLPCLLAVAAAAAAVDPGEILLSEMNCVACHAAEPAVQQRLASRQAPRLGRQGVRIAPGHLRAFLESPVATKPGTLMPDTLHAMDPAKKAAVAESLTHYLISLEDPQAPRAAAASSAVIQEGKRLYHSVGCVQCHAPQELPATAAALPTAAAEYEQLQQSSVPLGPVAEKYSVGALAGFLRDPLQARPAGRMPSLKLSEAEARAIAMYLLRAQVPGGLPTRLEGLAYDYYEKQLPELPEFDRLEPKTSGVSATFTLQVAERKNDFALRFRGTLMAEKAGEYKFWTRSDDGSRLSIDGQALVENGGVHPAQDRDGKVQLAAGEHVIEVTYYDAGGNSELAVQWQPPGGKRGAIPAALLSHEGQPMVPTAREGAGAFVVDALKAAQGAQHYVTLQCAQCHGPLPAGLASGDVALPKAKPLAQLRPASPQGVCPRSPPRRRRSLT